MCRAFSIRDAAGVTYQVKAGTMARVGTTYRGTLSLVDGLPQTSWTDFTDYIFQISDPNDTNADGIPDLTDPTASMPVITTQPRAQTANVGQTVTLAVGALGAEFYQWSRGGLAVPGGTNASLVFSSIQLTDAGTYSVSVTNLTGSVTSNAALLTVSLAPSRPAFTQNPLSLNLVRGNLLVLTADATGTPSPSFQWRKSGVQIAGATSRNYTIQSVSAIHTGTYDCVATNSVGATTSFPAALTVVDASTDTSRLSNLSIRTNAGSGAQSLITGFTVGGQATVGTTALLVRGAGPSLSQFGLSGVLADPTMAIYSGNTIIASNNDWAGNAQIKSLAAQVGAFNFSSDLSKDSAVALNSIGSGGFSSQITDAGAGTGVALAEIYDAVPAFQFSEGTPRLINVSARAQAGNNADALIAGFVVSGTTAKTLLIRAAGPALSGFGVPGVLSDPKLELYASSRLLAANDDWAGNADISRVGASVGAFALSAGSKDAALLATLPPGNYSAQVTGANNEVGVALVEVYEVPHPIGSSFATVLAEPFTGTTIDPTVWQSIKPFAGSAVVPTTGGVLLTQRGTIVSVNSFPSSITVSGQVSFNSGNEHFNIYLHSDGQIVAGNATAERTGVGCYLTSDVLSIQQSGSSGAILILTSKPYVMQTGRFYDFTIKANGSSFSLAINGTTELTASSNYAPGNKIVFMNREFTGVTSTLRNVMVTVP